MSEKEIAKWNIARNVILGTFGFQSNRSYGIKLARDCKHPDAQWFCGLVDLFSQNGDLKSLFRSIQWIEMANFMRSINGWEKDARMFYFIFHFGFEPYQMLESASNLGYPPAMSEYAVQLWCFENRRDDSIRLCT